MELDFLLTTYLDEINMDIYNLSFYPFNINLDINNQLNLDIIDKFQLVLNSLNLDKEKKLNLQESLNYCRLNYKKCSDSTKLDINDSNYIKLITDIKFLYQEYLKEREKIKNYLYKINIIKKYQELIQKDTFTIKEISDLLNQLELDEALIDEILDNLIITNFLALKNEVLELYGNEYVKGVEKLLNNREQELERIKKDFEALEDDEIFSDIEFDIEKIENNKNQFGISINDTEKGLISTIDNLISWLKKEIFYLDNYLEKNKIWGCYEYSTIKNDFQKLSEEYKNKIRENLNYKKENGSSVAYKNIDCIVEDEFTEWLAFIKEYLENLKNDIENFESKYNSEQEIFFDDSTTLINFLDNCSKKENPIIFWLGGADSDKAYLKKELPNSYQEVCRDAHDALGYSRFPKFKKTFECLRKLDENTLGNSWIHAIRSLITHSFKEVRIDSKKIALRIYYIIYNNTVIILKFDCKTRLNTPEVYNAIENSMKLQSFKNLKNALINNDKKVYAQYRYIERLIFQDIDEKVSLNDSKQEKNSKKRQKNKNMS